MISNLKEIVLSYILDRIYGKSQMCFRLGVSWRLNSLIKELEEVPDELDEEDSEYQFIHGKEAEYRRILKKYLGDLGVRRVASQKSPNTTAVTVVEPCFDYDKYKKSEVHVLYESLGKPFGYERIIPIPVLEYLIQDLIIHQATFKSNHGCINKIGEIIVDALGERRTFQFADIEFGMATFFNTRGEEMLKPTFNIECYLLKREDGTLVCPSRTYLEGGAKLFPILIPDEDVDLRKLIYEEEKKWRLKFTEKYVIEYVNSNHKNLKITSSNNHKVSFEIPDDKKTLIKG